MNTQRLKLYGALLIIVVSIAASSHCVRADDIRNIVFPVLGASRYGDDFGNARSGGRTHEGNDVFGTKHQPLVAAVDGEIWSVPFPEPSWGYAVVLVDKDDYEYWYIHINNDTPGTDDGQGGGRNAYAPGMDRGLPVVAGQLIGWMGDSGNAEATSPHLHFEIRRPDGNAINPFSSLQQARRVDQPTVPPALPGELLPYGEFRGGATVAAGELNGDPSGRELVTGAGPGGGPQVRVFDTNGNVLWQFLAFHADYRGGVDVATGDVNADGIDEIIAVPTSNANPIVRTFDRRGVLMREFLAYPETMKAGLNVTAADFNNDGRTEIIIAPRQGGEPLVRVFRPSGTIIRQFFAYGEQFRGGVDVAAIGATDEAAAMIVTAAGPGGGPHVRIFSDHGEAQGQFFPYSADFRGGVRVSVGEVDRTNLGPEIITVPASRGGPDFRVFSAGAVQIDRENEFERWWTGGYDIAASGGFAYVSSAEGGRRASVRTILRSRDFYRIKPLDIDDVTRGRIIGD